jgi:competence protein ComEC
MRSVFNEIPMLKLVLPFMAGVGIEIAADAMFHQAEWWLVFFAGLLIVSMAYAVLFRFRSLTFQFRWQVTEGIAFAFVFTSLAYILTWFHTTINYPDHFSKHCDKQKFLVATIAKPPVLKEKIVTTVAEVEEVADNNLRVKTHGKLLLSFMRNGASENLKYGDEVIVPAKIEQFDAPQNPEEFDFKLYQSFHAIYHRSFVLIDNWRVLRRNNGNPLLTGIYCLRESFLQTIRKHVTNENDFAVASAMLLGYNDFMNDELVQAYATSGALHVLSVSGLHVGIMFYILNLLLGWLDKKGQSWKVAKAFIVVVFIWFYACLTGLCPSVMRAAAMFSMMQFGKVLYRNVNIYNIIAASILILMLFNPFIVTEIGFRLSYLAVIGIIYLQPKISSWFVFKNKLLQGAWTITAVSIAAQIATFPIGLYYFHQFPNLFLVSNLVVIPMGNLALFLGTGLFMLSWIPYVSFAIGWVMAKMIWLLNEAIFLVEKVPYSLIEGISITMLQMFVVYAVILALCWFVETKRSRAFLAALSFTLLLSALFAFDYYEDRHKNQLVVYKVKGKNALALISNGKVLHDFDEGLLNNKSSMLFHVRHHWWELGVSEEKKADEISEELPFGKLFSFSGKRILVVENGIEKQEVAMADKLSVDYVILSNNARVYVSNLQKVVSFSHLIFDSSNKPWRVGYWKKDCQKLNVWYWDVHEKGAFVAEL